MFNIVIFLIKNLTSNNSSVEELTSSTDLTLSDVLDDMKNNRKFLLLNNKVKNNSFFNPKINSKVEEAEILKKLEEFLVEKIKLDLDKAKLEDIKLNLNKLEMLKPSISDVNKAKIRPNFFKSNEIKLENLSKKGKELDIVKTIDIYGEKYYQKIKKAYPNLVLYEKKTKWKINEYMQNFNLFFRNKHKFNKIYDECSHIISNAFFDLEDLISKADILAKFNLINIISCLLSPLILVAMLTKLILFFKNKKILPPYKFLTFFEFENEENLIFFLKFILILIFVFFNTGFIINFIIAICFTVYSFGWTLAYVIKSCILITIETLIGPSFNLFPIEFLLIIFSAVWFYVVVICVMYSIFALFLYVINPLLTLIIMNMLKYLK